MFDLTAAQPILKEDYLPPTRDQLTNDNFVVMKLVQKKQEATGKRGYVPLHYGRNNGVGYRSEGAALPTAGSQKYKESTFNCKYLYGSIELTGPTIKSARNDKGAFLRAVDSEMKGLVKDLKDQRARAIFGDGSGRLATFAVNTAVNTLTVNKVKYFQVGMKIDIVNSGGTVSVAGREITAIDRAGKTITINGAAVTTASTDFAVVTGDYNVELMGLGGIMSTSLTLQGINPNTDSWWKPNVIANGSPRAITEALMRQAMDFSELEGGKIDLLTASYGVRASYEALLQDLKRFTNPTKLEGGFSALLFDDRPIIVDRYHESGEMNFIDLDEIDLYSMGDFDWMEDDKGSILEKVQGFDKYTATMYVYETLVTYKRNAHTKLDDITEPTGYIE